MTTSARAIRPASILFQTKRFSLRFRVASSLQEARIEKSKKIKKKVKNKNTRTQAAGFFFYYLSLSSSVRVRMHLSQRARHVH